MIPELRLALERTGPHGRLRVVSKNQVFHDLCNHLSDKAEMATYSDSSVIGQTVITDLRDIPSKYFEARVVIVVTYVDDNNMQERTIESVQDQFDIIRVAAMSPG